MREVLALHAVGSVKASAHITGGGITGRATRLLQPGQRLRIVRTCYDVPPIFDLIAQSGNVDIDEMRRTFNMGLGFMAVVAPQTAERYTSLGNTAFKPVGSIVAGDTGIDFV